jgi:hypothetical protein
MFKLSLPEKKTVLETLYTNAIALLVSGDVSSYEFTISGELLLIPDHDFIVGCVVRVSNTGGALPNGLVGNTDYYVISVNGDEVELSAELNGDAVDITSVGSGIQTITENPLIETIATHSENLLPLWTRHEVTIPRQSIVFGNVIIDGEARFETPPEVVYSPDTAIDYRYLVIIRGGVVTNFSSQGEIIGVIDDGEGIIDLDGKVFILNPKI